jgi:hypothetical protein
VSSLQAERACATYPTTAWLRDMVSKPVLPRCGLKMSSVLCSPGNSSLTLADGNSVSTRISALTTGSESCHTNQNEYVKALFICVLGLGYAV